MLVPGCVKNKNSLNSTNGNPRTSGIGQKKTMPEPSAIGYASG